MRITDSTVNLVSERRYRESYTLTRTNASVAGMEMADSVSGFSRLLMSSRMDSEAAGESEKRNDKSITDKKE